MSKDCKEGVHSKFTHFSQKVQVSDGYFREATYLDQSAFPAQGYLLVGVLVLTFNIRNLSRSLFDYSSFKHLLENIAL